MATNTTANSSDSLVDSKAIADRFGVTVSTVNRWMRDGVIPCLRPSRRIVRFRLDDVEAAILQSNIGADNDGQ